MTAPLNFTKNPTPNDSVHETVTPARRFHLPHISMIEVLIVFCILAILAAIALPIFINQQKLALAAAGASAITGNQPQTGTGTKTNPIHGATTWYNTAEGAVKCLTAGGGTHETPTYTCDWASLKAGANLATAATLTGNYVSTTAGTMFCINTKNSAGQLNYECDWAHASNTLVRG